jgi:hypothetical protein
MDIPWAAAEDVRKMMLDRIDYMAQALMRAVIEDAADSSTINAHSGNRGQTRAYRVRTTCESGRVGRRGAPE